MRNNGCRCGCTEATRSRARCAGFQIQDASGHKRLPTSAQGETVGQVVHTHKEAVTLYLDEQAAPPQAMRALTTVKVEASQTALCVRGGLLEGSDELGLVAHRPGTALWFCGGEQRMRRAVASGSRSNNAARSRSASWRDCQSVCGTLVPSLNDLGNRPATKTAGDKKAGTCGRAYTRPICSINTHNARCLVLWT